MGYALDELRELSREFRIHLGFEGGEAETLVLDCPMFKEEIRVVEAERVWDGQRGMYIISRVGEVSKLE